MLGTKANSFYKWKLISSRSYPEVHVALKPSVKLRPLKSLTALYMAKKNVIAALWLETEAVPTSWCTPFQNTGDVITRGKAKFFLFVYLFVLRRLPKRLLQREVRSLVASTCPMHLCRCDKSYSSAYTYLHCKYCTWCTADSDSLCTSIDHRLPDLHCGRGGTDTCSATFFVLPLSQGVRNVCWTVCANICLYKVLSFHVTSCSSFVIKVHLFLLPFEAACSGKNS